MVQVYWQDGGPLDRDEWFMTQQTVNASDNPGEGANAAPAPGSGKP
jgi:predicted metalloendopeptidase